MGANTASMTLKENIKRLMKERKLNNASLAREAGVGQTGVYDILNKRSASPKVKTVEKIAIALDVPLISLFLEPSEFDDIETIVALCLSLDPQTRRQLIVTARAWAGSDLGEPGEPAA